MILYKIADKIIFNILKRISVGYLEITSISGELLKFGNYDDKLKADLKIKSSSLSYNLIKGGSVGLAECYMRDEFETNNFETNWNVDGGYSWSESYGNLSSGVRLFSYGGDDKEFITGPFFLCFFVFFSLFF